MLSRRAFLHSAAALGALAAAPRALAQPAATTPPPLSLTILDLTVEGPKEFGRRFTLFVPNHLAKDERVPLLVLLHGLGETGDPRLGVYAWHERYGLGSAYDRLRRPPITRSSSRVDIRDAQLAEVNAKLAAQPFRGLCIACPYTPNIPRMGNPAGSFDSYAAWLSDVVIPRARKEAPVFADPAHTYLDGCSLGGGVGLEVFLRRPEQFAAWGGVQSAFGVQRAPGFADRIAAALPRVAKLPGKPAYPLIHLETSTGDPFHDSNVALSARLNEKGIANDLLVLPGPHDQPWLREAGTLSMLLWHDRRPR
jgi:hypothetical protein